MTRQQAAHPLTTPMREGWWTVSPSPQATLGEVLGRVAAADAERLTWQGIAYTTEGARAIGKADGSTLYEVHGSTVQGDTVYELRLWLAGLSSHLDTHRGPGGSTGPETSSGAPRTTGAPGRVLARELRWLNGSGATEVTVYADSASATAQPTEGTREPCWLRENTYLQHGADPSSTDGTMTSIEVFVDESDYYSNSDYYSSSDCYSNTVFIDELMTGRWNLT